MKVYALGNLRVIYGSLIVFLGILIRDFIPNPDVLCKQLRLYQYKSCRWITELLFISTKGKQVFVGESRNAVSRKDLIHSIKERTILGELSKAPPHHFKFWAKLIDPWQSLTNGGPR